jgi:hypothetical protein
VRHLSQLRTTSPDSLMTSYAFLADARIQLFGIDVETFVVEAEARRFSQELSRVGGDPDCVADDCPAAEASCKTLRSLWRLYPERLQVACPAHFAARRVSKSGWRFDQRTVRPRPCATQHVRSSKPDHCLAGRNGLPIEPSNAIGECNEQVVA